MGLRGSSPKRSQRVNSLACLAMLFMGLRDSSASSSFETQLSLVLPWPETQDSQREPIAVFDAPTGGGQVAVAVTGLTTTWELAGTAVTVGTANGSTHVAASRLWTLPLPLGGSIPSAVAAAGELAVLELDGRLLGVQPFTGALAWNATSPCSLGKPRFVSTRSAADAVYLICRELSGDSTILALHPANGTTAWAQSSSSVAAALAPVRAAAAAQGLLVYAGAGSNVTALSATDGSLLWEVDVAPLAVDGGLAGAQQGAAVTHLHIADDVLLVREHAAGLSFSDGPCSYLALQLNASGAPPTLLWSALSLGLQRDRLPPTLTEASPAVPPAVSAADGVFYYWAATLPPPQSPAPPPPAAPLEPQWTATGASTDGPGASLAEAPAAARRRLAADIARRLLESASPASSPAAAPAPAATPVNATEAANAASAAAEAAAAAAAALALAVSPETQGLGVVAPEGVLSTPLLKARLLATGEELWTAELQPVSAPSATEGAVAVVTPDGLQVLDAVAGGAPSWLVGQRPLGIYPYTPTLLAAGQAAAVRNCLDTLASNSLCIYGHAPANEAGGAQGAGDPPTSGAAATAACGLGLRAVLGAAAAAMLLLL